MRYFLAASAVPATLMGLALVASAASAQTGGVSCHRSARHLVIERERTDSVGSDFIARPRPSSGETSPCAFEAGASDFRIDAPDAAFHFNALRGDHLVLEDSTGPSGNLVVFNLATRRKVLDVPVGDDVAADDAGVTYWQRTADGTTVNCKEFAKYKKDGFGARIETRLRFVFATEATASDKQTRCAPSQ